MILPKVLLPASLLLAAMPSIGQVSGVTPDDLLKPLKDSWPTYNGDYTGRRFSALTQVNRANVKQLTLAWTSQVAAGADNPESAGEQRRANILEAPDLIVGGEGPGNISIEGGSIKCSMLEVDGTLYLTMPDNAWAVDAHDGHVRWHYFWKTKGGTHIANRGVGMWNNYLYMETPDDYLVSLDARTGKER